MTKAEACQLKDQIVALCLKHKQWVNTTYEHKPELKMVRLEISIKVGDAAQTRPHR